MADVATAEITVDSTGADHANKAHIIPPSTFETDLLNTEDGHPQVGGDMGATITLSGLKAIAKDATPSFWFKFAYANIGATKVGFTVVFKNALGATL